MRLILRNQILFFALFFLIAFSSKAQLPVIIHETFDANDNDWPLGSSESYFAIIKDGKFILTTFNEDKGRFVTISPYLDGRHDFSIEASFVQKSGLTDNGIGLLWGRSGNSYHAFQIAINGYYKIHTPEKKEDFNKWIKVEGVNGLNLENVLKVELRNGSINCYLNNKLVTTFLSLSLYGNGVGFVNNTKMVLEVDDFIFKNDIKINLPENYSGDFKKENMGNEVNSIYDDLSPKISANGNTLYFGRKKSTENIGGVEDEEDIWYSTLQNGTWGKSKNLGEPINSKLVNNLIAVSSDENTMIFSSSEGFAKRERTKTGWTDLIEMGIHYTNEDDFIEGCLSSDGKAILFTVMNSSNVNYRQTKQERDIYVCLKGENNTWSSPINLGKNVNTSENEYSPFLASDGKTLYFASAGWPGYGSADIFLTKRLDESWTKWTEPVNLGGAINTLDFDAYYTVPAAGDYAYLTSSHHSIGKSDIFRVRLNNEVKPDPVVLISGRTINAKTKVPIQTNIFFENLTTGKEVGEAQSNPTNGNYKIVLPYGFNYGFRAVAKGFLSVNENFDLIEIKSYSEVKKDLLLVPIEIGESVQLRNVFFEQGKALLKEESKPELDRLITILVDNPTITIELSGHTDNVGSRSSLLMLSNDRVKTVKNYLVTKGIVASRIAGKGYGSSIPLQKNDTEEHRKMNRRVEFKITRK